MKIIGLTGATGHIGNNLARELVKRGYHVKALVRNEDISLDDLKLERVFGDITNMKSVASLCKGCDVVYHAAAKISFSHCDKINMQQVNVNGTRNVIQGCLASGVKRLIHFSSVAAIDHYPLSLPMDEHRQYVGERASVYGYTKALSEQLVRQAASSRLTTITLAPTGVLGPYDFKPSQLGRAMLQVQRYGMAMVLPGGYYWIDVRDIVNVALNCLDLGRSGEKYLLPGTWVSLPELFNELGKMMNKRIRKIVLPVWMVKSALSLLQGVYRTMGKALPLGLAHESVEIVTRGKQIIHGKKAEKELGYTARPFSETLMATYAWFEQHHL